MSTITAAGTALTVGELREALDGMPDSVRVEIELELPDSFEVWPVDEVEAGVGNLVIRSSELDRWGSR